MKSGGPGVQMGDWVKPSPRFGQEECHPPASFPTEHQGACVQSRDYPAPRLEQGLSLDPALCSAARQRKY